jgi:Spy/CpxP family protein refolding chaperone
MITAIFGDTPDANAIEQERIAIARLQEQQQRAVIRQMMDERHILTPIQRSSLARFLIEQYPLGSLEQALAQEPSLH